MHTAMQSANFGILTRKCLFPLKCTSKNCLKRTREQRAEEWALILTLKLELRLQFGLDLGLPYPI